MMLVARTRPDEYERLPLIVVACLVGEWRQAFEHAQVTHAGAEQTIEVLTHLGDAAEGWRRKRDLPRGTAPAVLVADARDYATSHPAELAAWDQAYAGVRSFLTRIGGK